MYLSNLWQILLIRRAPGRDRLRPDVGCGRDGDGEGDGAVSAVGEGNIGMLRRQTGQVLCSDSHGTMQSEWYRCPQGSRRAAAASGRGSVQTAQTSAVSETVTVGSAAMDAAGTACDPPRWTGELITGA